MKIDYLQLQHTLKYFYSEEMYLQRTRFKKFQGFLQHQNLLASLLILKVL